MASKRECWRCNRIMSIQSKGLCSGCAAYYKRRPDDPDAQYELWLRGATDAEMTAVPKAAAEWLLGMVRDRFETDAAAAVASGVSERRLGAAMRGEGNLGLRSGWRIASELGVLHEFDVRVCEVGRDDWSEVGTYCGDGSGVLDGCGSYFHEHYANGLCEECWMREVLGQGPELPRDVRLVQS